MNGNLDLSIVIPTYNRKDVLKKCLDSLSNQTYPKTKYEIIVVDDGSTDGTEVLVAELSNKIPFSLRYFKQENKGPAAARNLGIKNAHGGIILFIGDDCIADSNLLEEHMKYHEKFEDNAVAILGYTIWHPELKITPFMHWLENSGLQFAYSKIKNGEEVGYRYFLTSNVSLNQLFMLKNGVFDESFPYAAYEDTELGYILQEKGLQIIFNRNAIIYHYHPTNLVNFCKRQRMVGRSAVIFNKKWPSVCPLNIPRNLRKKFLTHSIRFIAPTVKPLLAKLDEYGCRVPHIFYYVVLYNCYQIGLEEELKRVNVPAD